jgi:hypothetical protein
MDTSTLKLYSDKGLLKCNKHPMYDLCIWNYSEKVQYNKEWDDITLMTRGLITDIDGNIVSRNFSKFFNLEEYNQEYVNINSDPFKDNFKVYEKLDGSLGILFYYNEWIFCTRGSFTSVQSIQGKSILDKKIDYSLLDKSLTYTFEIIYPLNRIVVDYDITEDVIFLSAFEKNGKERHDIRQKFISLNLNVVKEYTSKDPYLLKDENVEGREGYVMVFENGERLKIKFENYIKLHRLVSNLSVQNAFDWIKSGKPISEIVELIPDEYHSWYNSIVNKVNDEYNRISTLCYNDYFNIRDKSYNEKNFNPNKRDFALIIKEHLYKTLLFKMYDTNFLGEDPSFLKQEPYNTIIFKYIENSDFFKQLKKDDLPLAIRDTYINSRYNNILNLYENSDDLIVSSSNQPCYIFDIDGTLSLIKRVSGQGTGRSPYDMSRVLEDIPNKPVVDMLNILLCSNFVIIIVTGRSEDSEEKTKLWLKMHNIKYNDIFFRPFKNREPDYLVKEKMWRHINKKYNIVSIFDDRNQVVNHARKLGLTVFQVADGNF